ncbi:helix-turn-helix domain-containing protein [Actinomadura sp. CNU-125]|uniref:helix-turn-helix domain-containing protein n=1 Tax=Actinomadura sp. CNU-125 TaxID=1904961 RepID=UPI0021CCDE27|nr:helix-turn-helix transcriptional regulator [Actinomadura sp. CNU-125]
MPESMPAFGAELRRKRLEAGLSLARLGALLHYSKGHLSKIEHGRKSPSPELARMSDAVLDAGGTLIALASRPRDVRLDEQAPDDEVWLMNLSLNGQSRFHPMNRREALAVTSTSVLGFGLGARGMTETAGEPTALAAFRTLFARLRDLGQTASPGAVLPLVVTQTHVLRARARAPPSGPGTTCWCWARASPSTRAGWRRSPATTGRPCGGRRRRPRWRRRAATTTSPSTPWCGARW